VRDLTPKEVIYNKPYPAILLKISDKYVRNIILIFIQEVKWDIIFHRMQLKGPKRQAVLRIRMQAHLLSVTLLLSHSSPNKTPNTHTVTMSHSSTFWAK
jgi:hypothetical protein